MGPIWPAEQEPAPDEFVEDSLSPPPDVPNAFFVGLKGDKITFLRPFPQPLTKDEALNLAANIVVIADPGGQKFKALVRAIQES